MSRTDEIAERLNAFLREHGCTPAELSLEQWKVAPTGRFRFGWTMPVAVDSPPTSFVAIVCPEMIALTTNWLSDDLLTHYLATIEAFVLGRIANPDLSADEAMTFVDGALYEDAPDTLKLMNEVEAQAIDDHLV